MFCGLGVIYEAVSCGVSWWIPRSGYNLAQPGQRRTPIILRQILYHSFCQTIITPVCILSAVSECNTQKSFCTFLYHMIWKPPQSSAFIYTQTSSFTDAAPWTCVFVICWTLLTALQLYHTLIKQRAGRCFRDLWRWLINIWGLSSHWGYKLKHIHTESM